MLQKTGEKTMDSSLASSRSNSTTLLDLAGSKLRKKLGSSLQESSAAPASDFAKKQLEKMGWTEGTGLGKRRDGIKTHIRVKKREEQAGLGIEKAAVEKRLASEEWWKDSLGDTLAKLSRKKDAKGSKKRKRNFTDEELFEATGGVRFGTKGAMVAKKAVNLQCTEKSSNNALFRSALVSESDSSLHEKSVKISKEGNEKCHIESDKKKTRKKRGKDSKKDEAKTNAKKKETKVEGDKKAKKRKKSNC